MFVPSIEALNRIHTVCFFFVFFPNTVFKSILLQGRLDSKDFFFLFVNQSLGSPWGES